MFGPWIEMWGWLKSLMPRRLRFHRPRFSFIMLHYGYIVFMALLTSVIIYGDGKIPYIDALFFGSGAATQSGLNTIDVSNLQLYQQVTIMIVACLCTPIFIHGFVVFIRLYWFEKRFQNIVQDARAMRHTRTRSRTRSQAKADLEADVESNGVNGRAITVLRGPDGKANGKHGDDEKDGVTDGDLSNGATIAPTDGNQTPSSATFHRDITFADQTRPSAHRKVSNLERVPERRTAEQHIAFVESQRNQKDKGTLWIPGPRDYEAGHVPQQVDDADGGPLDQESTVDRTNSQMDGTSPGTDTQDELNGDDHPFKRHITIDEPSRPGTRGQSKSAFSRFPFQRSTGRADDDLGATTVRARGRSNTLASFLAARTQDKDEDPMPYLSWAPTIGRNSAFVDLTEEQREELGGIEYRALKTLAFILIAYYVGFHLLAMICLLPWIVRSRQYSDVVRASGSTPVWWGLFTPASLFNDLGFTLTPDSMVSFQKAVFPLLLGSFLIIIGNTGFPCMLRFVIWVCERLVPRDTAVWEELRFLLDHPRRCFTLLFPSAATWWLFWILVILNGVDLIFFIILDLNDTTVTSLPPGIRVLDGWFQASSTRTAGFAVVNLADLHPAIQVSYLVMMYISVFPIAISLRRTNVYEEKSLGIYAGDNEDSDEATNNATAKEQSYVGTHLRRQLSFDLWYVFLGFFLIAIIEGGRLENTNDYAFTLFSVLFEIISAYGTVGLSLGYPGFNTSFSGQFKTLSKLIIIAMQIRGRHRGLPYALDRAILLPSESLHKKEAEDAIRRARRGSTASQISGGDGQGAASAAVLARESTRASANRDRERESGGLMRIVTGALSAGPMLNNKGKKA
ncbi:potassium transport protein TRK1/TRK2 [Patellaria atrata CBS 101060]|uniref:Potassium transport protein n=1 Tax=Patellaria atrata CBS 101060 TaxID=1346257 RepID=A0A9P4SF80_9PEZI|nr:potassium transport protein TRK1/TRK2 [Patellaria atrata CBS 101060]